MRRLERPICGIFIGLLSSALAFATPAIGLIDLIANAENYGGREVSVYGIFFYEPGYAAIYLTREDGQYGISPNGVGLEINPKTNFISRQDRSVAPERLSGRYVCVKGVVDASGVHALQRWRVLLRNVSYIHEQVPMHR